MGFTCCAPCSNSADVTVLFYVSCIKEKYLQDVWPTIKSALREHGITCELNLVSICNLHAQPMAELADETVVPLAFDK